MSVVCEEQLQEVNVASRGGDSCEGLCTLCALLAHAAHRQVSACDPVQWSTYVLSCRQRCAGSMGALCWVGVAYSL